MKITGKIKVSAETIVNAPSRLTGDALRFGVGEEIRLAPAQSLPGTGAGTWSIQSGGGQIHNDGDNRATYTARDLSEAEFLQNKRSYDVVLALNLSGEQLEIGRAHV